MLEGISIVQLTPPVLLGIAILMLLTGRLVPRSIYRDKVHEAEQWRSAYEAEREARTESDTQTRQLLELARVSEPLLTAIVQNSERAKSGEG